MNITKTYCLDTNVLIQAWSKYYSPSLCPGYWDILSDLGMKKRIFIPEEVRGEIHDTEDNLLNWLKSSKISINKTNEDVTRCLREIYAKKDTHKYLVDNTKGRSLADPWVIAHAMSKNAIVVTKEEKTQSTKPEKVKIPDVCESMGVKWINDFQFLAEIKVRFSCQILPDDDDPPSPISKTLF